MKYAFDRDGGLIIATAEIEGPSGSAILRMALDTGATTTLVNAALLVAIGCDVAASTDRVELTTGSGVDYAARLDVDAIRALGVKRRHFQVLAHTLPPTAGVDGLLGVDFFFDRVLTIDFQHNTLEVL